MALNLRATLEGSDISGNNAEVRIYLEGFSGTAVTRNGLADFFEITWGDSNTELLPVVYGSRATVRFLAETDYEFIDLFTTTARDVYIEIELTDTSTIIWKGFIEPEKYTEPLIAPPYEVSLTSYDGLGLLKEAEFLDTGRAFYTGEKTLFEILLICLGETGLELPVNTKVNYRPNGQSTSADALLQTKKDVVVYREKSCYDVLNQLFVNCRIFQRGGEWYVISNDAWQNATITCFAYTSAGVANGTKAITTKAANWWIEGEATLEIMPAIKQLRVKQNYGLRTNIVENGNFAGFDGSNFDNWTATGVTIQQRVLNDYGDKFIYMNGKEDWVTFPSKYVKSDGIAVKASTSNLNVELAYALMGTAGKSARMYFSLQLVTATTTYVLIAQIPSGEETKPPSTITAEEVVLEYVWFESTNLLYVPLSSKVISTKSFLGSTWTRSIEINEIDAYPWNEIGSKFKRSTFSVNEIPEDGTLYLYLLPARTSDTSIAGPCFSKASLNFTDESNNDLPSSTEFVLENSLNNNFIPDELELINGDVPDLPNRLTIYQGSFILASDGSATDLWKLDSDANTYTFAELMGRLICAENKSIKQSYRIVLADLLPDTSMVIQDTNNSSKLFLEAGITYNFEFQRIEGRFIELKSISLNTYTKTEYVNYEKPATGSTSSGSTAFVPVAETETDTDPAIVVAAVQPRANTVSLTSGENNIQFDEFFPEDTNYVVQVFTYDVNGYQVANTVNRATQDESGFKITVPKACTLIYNAIPIK